MNYNPAGMGAADRITLKSASEKRIVSQEGASGFSDHRFAAGA
jgi:hypothetical protein